MAAGTCDPAAGAPVAVQDAAGDRPDPRQGRERGVRAAEVLEEARGEADREDAQVGGGERGAEGAQGRTSRFDVDELFVKRRSSTKGRSSSGSCRGAGPRDADPEAHEPRGDPRGRPRRASNGTEDASDRLPARHRQALARRAGTPTRTCRRCSRRTSCSGSTSRRGSGTRRSRDIHIERKPGKVDGDDAHRPSGRRDRQEGRRGRQAARRAGAADRQGSRRSTSRRSSGPSSSAAGRPTTSRTSWRSASRSAAP